MYINAVIVIVLWLGVVLFLYGMCRHDGGYRGCGHGIRERSLK